MGSHRGEGQGAPVVVTDYGHAIAAVTAVERQAERLREEGWDATAVEAEAARKRERVANALWRCRKCSAVAPVARQSACEHSFTWDYDMIETADEVAERILQLLVRQGPEMAKALNDLDYDKRRSLVQQMIYRIRLGVDVRRDIEGTANGDEKTG